MSLVIQQHWPEYAIEAVLLGTFMFIACAVVVVFEYSESPVRRAIAQPMLRRILIGVLMGLTAVALIYSPLGQRSGAHMNPATTLTFWLLGKLTGYDAVGYMIAQFAGGLLGVTFARLLLGRYVMHGTVRCAATTPGRFGIGAAWLGEFVIAFAMMSMVLFSTNHESTAPYTGVFAGVLVALFISIEAPISGMSMNPARTLASAVPVGAYRGLWIYFSAPPLAMFTAAFVFTSLAGGHVYCAKLNHSGQRPCIFHCEMDVLRPRLPLPR